MFGLGMGELMIILLLALLFLGPKRLPDIASTLGKAIRSFRKATTDLQDQLEVDDSVKQPFRELKAALRDDPAPIPTPPIAKAIDKPVEPAVTAAPAVAAVPVDSAPAEPAPADAKKADG